MIIELINSLFVTFVATECLLVSTNNNTRTSTFYSTNPQSKVRIGQFQFSRSLQILTIIVSLINIFVHFHDRGVALSKWIQDNARFSRATRIVSAIAAFLLSLWCDCRRIANASASKNSMDDTNNKAPTKWSNKHFLVLLVKSFCRILPIYPFAAVVISFICLFIITLFEDLKIGTAILNWPIYYCTLYGPLMLLYWDVKSVFARSAVNTDIILPR